MNNTCMREKVNVRYPKRLLHYELVYKYSYPVDGTVLQHCSRILGILLSNYDTCEES